jgi:hypothetical protein
MEFPDASDHHAALLKPFSPNNSSALARHDSLRLPDIHLQGESTRSSNVRRKSERTEWSSRGGDRSGADGFTETAHERFGIPPWSADLDDFDDFEPPPLRRADTMPVRDRELSTPIYRTQPVVPGSRKVTRSPSPMIEGRVKAGRARASSSRYPPTSRSQRPPPPSSRTTSYVYTPQGLRDMPSGRASLLRGEGVRTEVPSQGLQSIPDILTEQVLSQRHCLDIVCHTVSRDDTSSEDMKVSTLLRTAFKPLMTSSEPRSVAGASWVLDSPESLRPELSSRDRQSERYRPPRRVTDYPEELNNAEFIRWGRFQRGVTDYPEAIHGPGRSVDYERARLYDRDDQRRSVEYGRARPYDRDDRSRFARDDRHDGRTYQAAY